MSIIATNLYLNPLVLILKHNSDHTALHLENFKWFPLAHRPSPQPQTNKNSSQTESFVSFHASYTLATLDFPNPTCAFLLLPVCLRWLFLACGNPPHSSGFSPLFFSIPWSYKSTIFLTSCSALIKTMALFWIVTTSVPPLWHSKFLKEESIINLSLWLLQGPN